MAQIVLVGIAAGAASALLFASVASGSLLAVALFYLAALPIMIAAIGWNYLAGLIAALVAGGSLAVVFGGFFFIAFLGGIGLPAWWLGYLALLARPVATPSGEPAPDDLEWYPAGHLVVWSALLGALIVIITIPNFGLDADSFRAGLKRLFEMVIRAQSRSGAEAPLQVPGVSDPNRLLDFLVGAIPPLAAVLSTLVNVANLWLAGHVVRVSGRLKRPWPDLPAMQFPNYAPMLLALAVAGTFAPGLLGIVAGILTASLLMAYAILGLAVLHAVTRGMGGRPLILAGAYAGIGVLGWPILAAALVGLVETLLGLRARIARRRGPGPPS